MSNSKIKWQLNPAQKEFNILLLGKSGDGKSTWINSIANFRKYETLDEALKHKPECIIPTSFQIPDENYKMHTVTVGERNNNERLDLTKSTTQKPKVYALKFDTATINFIDVPGIFNDRGREQDEINMRNILDTVALFNNLHAICIVLNAVDSVMSPAYVFCLNELLMHFHKQAFDNIFFIFTNSKTWNYVPGKGFTVLKEYLANLEKEKRIKKKLTPDCVFCIDNEAFLYQCSHSMYPKLKPTSESIIYQKSWNSTSEATKLFFQKMSYLNPHDVLNTVSVNDARMMINLLIGPLALMTSVIQSNQKNDENNFDDFVERIDNDQPIYEFEIVSNPLDYPKTVCTAYKCMDTAKENGKTVSFYKQICHDHCYLQNVISMRFPEEGLKSCDAMDNLYNCQRCGCSYNVHMHIRLDQRKIYTKKRYSRIYLNIDGKLIMETRIQNFEEEQKKITEATAKFATFLKNYSIWEYNKGFENMIKLEIREAENENSDNVSQLKDILKNHCDLVKKIDEQLKTTTKDHTVSAKEICDLKEELFNLPIHGKQIKMLYDTNYSSLISEYKKKNIKHYNLARFGQSKEFTLLFDSSVDQDLYLLMMTIVEKSKTKLIGKQVVQNVKKHHENQTIILSKKDLHLLDSEMINRLKMDIIFKNDDVEPHVETDDPGKKILLGFASHQNKFTNTKLECSELFVTKCPENCTTDPRQWICKNCGKFFKAYSFEVICDCGTTHIANLKFECFDSKHPKMFTCWGINNSTLAVEPANAIFTPEQKKMLSTIKVQFQKHINNQNTKNHVKKVNVKENEDINFLIQSIDNHDLSVVQQLRSNEFKNVDGDTANLIKTFLDSF